MNNEVFNKIKEIDDFIFLSKNELGKYEIWTANVVIDDNIDGIIILGW